MRRLESRCIIIRRLDSVSPVPDRFGDPLGRGSGRTRCAALGGTISDREIRAQVEPGHHGAYIVTDVDHACWATAASIRKATLADGRRIQHGVYRAAVVWDGQPRLLRADEVDTTPLLGMAMLEGCDLRLQVRGGGAVTIAQLS